nr:hypothetical protein [Tanacetum cinerariifolium]
SLSAKRTSWNEFSSAMALAVICLSTGPQPQGVDFPMSLLQEALDTYAALTRRVEHLEHDKVAQNLEITKLMTRVKKLERANKVKTLKLRRLRKVGTSQRVDTSDDTVMEDVSNQGRMIDELDKDEGAVLMNEKEETKEVRDITGDAQVEGRQAEIYQIDMDHAAKVLTDQSAQLLVTIKSQIPAMVDAHLGTRLKDSIQKALQSYTTEFEKEAQAEKKRYIDLILKSMKDIIKDEVKTQLPQPQSAYEAAASLTKFKLKKILIEKMEKNQSNLIVDSAQAEESVFKVADTEMLHNQGSDLGNTNDQPNVKAASKFD